MASLTGVYFQRSDYAGFWRRLMIDSVDLIVIGVVCLTSFAVVWMLSPSPGLILASWGAAFFSYFVLLKRSSLGTVGYRVVGVRIVGQDGGKPGISSLTLRMLFGVLGPLNWLDLVWLSGDTHRQALRDKLAGTYVVRKDARPAGTGKIVYRHYEILFYNFLFREVEVETTLTAG
jgi:uncharacterized RDD family membrane protein YckC